MGRLPALQLVERYGWHGLLLEPAPPTFRWLQHNFRAAPPGAATLRQVGVTAEATPQQVTMHVLAARVPELEGTAPADEPTVAGGSSRGLPAISRQRMQFGTSTRREVAEGLSNDLWQMNHLAGGPMKEALAAAGFAAKAKEFSRCVGESATAKKRCFDADIGAHAATLKPFSQLLDEEAVKEIDLLVVDVWDGSTAALLRSFPLDRIKPSVIYHRNGKGNAQLRSWLLSNGYSTSAHHETSSWGEHTIAWRSDRCAALNLTMASPLSSK